MKETLQETLGQGKKVKVEQKVLIITLYDFNVNPKTKDYEGRSKSKSILFVPQVDPSILGGLVVEFGQKVFDMSIKSRARQMERFLREPIHFGTL